MSYFEPVDRGFQRLSGSDRVARHRHASPYVAIVLAGSYREQGDRGRFEVREGEALFHGAYEAHANRLSGERTHILSLPATANFPEFARARISDPDRLARIAERNLVEAGEALAEMIVPNESSEGDWIDRLAAKLVGGLRFRLDDWAYATGIRPDSASRAFSREFGVTPSRYRLEAQARRAIGMIRQSNLPLAAIAADAGFADQPHMTRSIINLTGLTPGTHRRRASHPS